MGTTRTNLFFCAALMVAVALTLVGRLSGRHTDATDAGRVVLIYVPGLSWEIAAAEIKRGHMPYLGEIARGRSVRGDIVTRDYPNSVAIAASVATGMFPHNHGLTAAASDQKAGGPRNMLWHTLGDAGQPVAVIGSPFDSRLQHPDSFCVTPFIEDAAAVPAAMVDTVLSGLDTAAGVRADVEMALAGDITAANIAVDGMSLPGRHVFAWLPGLNLLRHEFADGTSHVEIPQRYYAALDSVLRRMIDFSDPTTTYMIVSGNGNRGKPVAYKPYFPENIPWPDYGFLLAWGRGIRRGDLPFLLPPEHLAPTLLYLAGAPIPQHMDGAIEHAMLEDDYNIRHKIRYSR